MLKILALLLHESDLALTKKGQELFADFSISYELRIASAHQNPAFLEELVRSFQKQGGQLIICLGNATDHGAAWASSLCNLPILLVPVDERSQSPSHLPIATMGCGASGFTQAALFALQVLAMHDLALAHELHRYRQSLAFQGIQTDKQHRILFDV